MYVDNEAPFLNLAKLETKTEKFRKNHKYRANITMEYFWPNVKKLIDLRFNSSKVNKNYKIVFWQYIQKWTEFFFAKSII